MAEYIKYEESRPSQLREMLEVAPVAYVPFGSLEWHGEHNPLGLDGLKAEELLRRTAEVTGGVLFPAVYWGAPLNVHFPFTFDFPVRVARRIFKGILSQLERDGFKVIVLLTGHYPPLCVAYFCLASRLFNRKGTAVALAFPEITLAHESGYYGDHAGHWETSIMMAMRPELVDVSEVPSDRPFFKRISEYGVMGRNPRTYADAALGEKVVEITVKRLSQLVAETLSTGTDEHLRTLWRSYWRHGVFSRGFLSSQIGKGFDESGQGVNPRSAPGG